MGFHLHKFITVCHIIPVTSKDNLKTEHHHDAITRQNVQSLIYYLAIGWFMSQDGRLCGNEENLNSLGDDYGYRSGSCLVCYNEQRARSTYEAALAAAQNQYNLVVNAAWSKKLEEEQEACYTIDTVILTT
ncbi:hypothetical protein BTUL_0069g00490 [Botrytis tulipae]|uniref:Uncharacterized protein n=1 Tax=Botrytis tulipae TaxID=87230 RepID=A0A4Z1ERS4_9HELO|nr:hypothetical protein BTUL_0069g00490 [Botrytis tulipae]